MFSFHKPKVYRSSTGCCICKAKSSSSRFTDSKKYEEDFIKCFQLEERRTGEICNACVLLVKRWKKLPVGSSRNWRHVVDARAGPGIKSLTKFKAKNKKKLKEVPEKFEKILKKKHPYSKNDMDREHSPAMSDDMTEEYSGGNESKGSSRAGSPAGSDDVGVEEKTLDINQTELELSNFIDLTYFKRKNVCCGVIFVGMMGEVLIEPSLLKPCLGCLARQQRQRAAAASLALVAGSSPEHSSSSSLASASPCHSSASTSPEHTVEMSPEVSAKAIGKGFCDSSSDSGYDDSNHGSVTERKKVQQQQPPPTAPVLQLIAKSAAKPAGKTHLLKTDKIPITSTTLRLKSVGTKIPIKLLCKPVALVSSAKLSLSNNNNITRPIETTVLKAVPATHDFVVRAPLHRQSLAN